MAKTDRVRTVVTWSLAVAGWVVSYAFFYPWMQSSGGDFFGGWALAFQGPGFSIGFSCDLGAVTAMVLFLAIWERRKLGSGWAVAIALSLMLSVSMALALYLVRSWQGAASRS